MYVNLDHSNNIYIYFIYFFSASLNSFFKKHINEPQNERFNQ